MKNWFVPSTENNFKPYLLRNVALVTYTLVLLIVNTLSGVLGFSEVSASSITSNNIVQLTNTERQKYGLPELKNNSKLASAALAKANNMFKEQYWDHFGPNGETPWQFIKNAGYVYVYAGENLAKGFRTSEGVVQAWMASPTHRENILSGNYKEIGIAVVSGKLLGDNVVLVVQMFGNTTNQTVASVKDASTPSKQIEQGDTKSIKITYPVKDQVITNPSFDVQGTATTKSDEYTVEVYDGAVILGNVKTDGDIWEFNKGADWTEGNHTVTAYLDKKGSGVSHSVDFIVDSTSPEVKDDQIAVSQENSKWNVYVTSEDSTFQMNVVTGNNNYSGSYSDGKYYSQIKWNGSEKVVLVMSDEYGNTLEKEITDKFPMNENISALASFVNSIDIRDTVNTLFVVFIFILLLIEIFVYSRKGLLKDHKGDMFAIGIWWMLLFVGTLNGFSGVIN